LRASYLALIACSCVRAIMWEVSSQDHSLTTNPMSY